jgi:3-hydroxyisobutyrate dehydrogenase-like beta-hydroxyacid dehydrogenase
VTVWNRSPEKMEPIMALGAKGAPDISAALQASPRILICIADYKATSMLLDRPRVTPHLEGRTIIQFTTGTPKEAGDCGTWVRKHGGSYLDGAIMVNPGDIGSADAQILVAGPQEAFQHCQRFLQCLGGDLRYLGPNVRAAATLDLALLSQIECMVFGMLHGALICEAESVALQQFAALLRPGISLTHLATLLPRGNRTPTWVQSVHDSLDAEGVAASVDVVVGVVARLQDQARDADINSEIPDFLMGLLKRAIAAGYGQQDSAAVINILRATKVPVTSTHG